MTDRPTLSVGIPSVRTAGTFIPRTRRSFGAQPNGASNVVSFGRMFALAGLVIVGLIATLVACLTPLQYPAFMAMSGLATLALLALMLIMPPRPGSGLLKAYFGVVVVFHFGLIPSYLLTFSGGSIEAGSYWIFDEHYTRQAVRACLVFIAVFAATTVLTSTLPSSTAIKRSIFKADPRMARVALFSLVTTIWTWFILVILVARPTSYMDYYHFFEVTGLGNAIAFLHTAIAASFFLACLNGRSVAVPFLLFALWAVFAFPLGLRAHVIFPLVLTLPLLMNQGRLRIHWLAMAAGVLLTMSASTIVAQSRVGAEIENASPLAALAELGGSLRPSYEVERWLYSGDRLRLGATYIAPVERTIFRILPVGTRVAGIEDHRLMNVLILKRAGPYGFSIIAEAVINFGLWGAAAVGAFAALILRWASARLALNHRPILNAAIAFGLIVHIRQAFVSGFGATLAFLACAGLLVLISRAIFRVTR